MATKTKSPCCECSKPTARLHPILGIPLCAECQRNLRDKYRYITKTRAITEYRLKPADLENLRAHKVDNPHYKTAAPMQLYLLSQIQALSRHKWGTTEPYLVTLVGFPDEYLAWLLEDLERLKHLSAEQFQHLIADRLEHMGLNVQLVGHCYRKDGGVDIIAYPQKYAVPFLLAVQCKHHGTNGKTVVGDVRDFYGVITSRNLPFHLGMIVTNTTFTPDAIWFAENNKTLLRLRDNKDLCRWLKNDFVNEYEWREIPSEIELAPGVRITIPKPKLWLPGK